MNIQDVFIDALVRILENQITIKEHLGIIKSRSKYDDNEYYRDMGFITELKKERSNIYDE